MLTTVTGMMTLMYRHPRPEAQPRSTRPSFRVGQCAVTCRGVSRDGRRRARGGGAREWCWLVGRPVANSLSLSLYLSLSILHIYSSAAKKIFR